MKQMKLIIFVLFAILIFVGQSSAKIPAFARKYGLSCSTCHNPIPKLKPFGEDFAGAGFKLEEEPKSGYKKTGDDLLTLQRVLPFGIRMDGYVQVQSDSDIKSDLKTPYLLKLMSGGILAPDIGYYFYFYMNERGEIAGVEDAYIHFNNLFGSELDVMAGQFQISDPLMKRELRLTLEDYHVYKVKPGRSKTNLTYDRGFMITYGFPTKTDVVFELVNGSGISEADEEHNFDSDTEKAYAFRLSQDLSFLRFGGFYYYAEESLGDNKNTVNWYGPDFTLGNDFVELNYQYLLRKDDNPYLLLNGLEVETEGHVAELTLMPKADKSRLYSVLLYNKIDSDLASLKYESVTGNLTYLLRRNLKLVAEFTRDVEHEKNKFSVGFVSGF